MDQGTIQVKTRVEMQMWHLLRGTPARDGPRRCRGAACCLRAADRQPIWARLQRNTVSLECRHAAKSASMHQCGWQANQEFVAVSLCFGHAAQRVGCTSMCTCSLAQAVLMERHLEQIALRNLTPLASRPTLGDSVPCQVPMPHCKSAAKGVQMLHLELCPDLD
jgi:hypothetical protein